VEFWTPGDTLNQREVKDKVPYRPWVEEGYLNAPSGRNIDYRAIARRIAELQMVYVIKSIAFDPYRIKYFESALEEEGVTVTLTPHGQGYYRSKESLLWMPRSIELLEKYVTDRVARIRRNPVLTWNSDSAVLEEDGKGNRIFTKRKSKGKIDGLVALAMAVGASETAEEKEPDFDIIVV
jgi:phage terminase large subunit-like protein